MKWYAVEKLKPSKTNPKHFYAIVRKDLIRVNLDDLFHFEKQGCGKILFRADITSHEIYDYQQLDEVRIAVLANYQLSIINQLTVEPLVHYRSFTEHQKHLILYPSFTLEAMPLLLF